MCAAVYKKHTMTNKHGYDVQDLVLKLFAPQVINKSSNDIISLTHTTHNSLGGKAST